MIDLPSPITPDGNIHIHAKQGAVIPFFFQQDDDSPRDMTGATVAFEMEGGVRIPLTAGQTVDEMVLTLEAGALNAALNGKKQFVVLDETGAEPDPVWAGHVMVWGFV